MRKFSNIVSLFVVVLWSQALASPSNASDRQLSGGTTSVFATSAQAFSLPAANTTLLQQDDFFIGRSFFRQTWVSAPASTTARDGLGALFNASSCQACHVNNGRGQPPEDATAFFSAPLIRLSIPALSRADSVKAQQWGSVPDPVYGKQLQSRSIRGVLPEGQARFDYVAQLGAFQDGETYTLWQPKLRLTALQYGAMHAQVRTSVRIAPAMIGLGLLAAIPEADIVAQADPDDRNGDGISGRANWVWDVQQQKTVLGRFGWKASQPSVIQQVASAFSNDIGITSALFPQAICTPNQSQCLQAPNGGEVEIPPAILQPVVYYASLLAVPARREVGDPEVVKGERLFHQAGCAACHTPAQKTTEQAAFPALAQQRIQPFTDLLLHDMGDDLADRHTEFMAKGNEWRTAPLWGLGLTNTVNGYTRLLHDGRARSIMEAILWHGGEAKSAQQAVLAMDKAQRQALLRFLNTL